MNVRSIAIYEVRQAVWKRMNEHPSLAALPGTVRMGIFVFTAGVDRKHFEALTQGEALETNGFARWDVPAVGAAHGDHPKRNGFCTTATPEPAEVLIVTIPEDSAMRTGNVPMRRTTR
jgi:hypothetical protein